MTSIPPKCWRSYQQQKQNRSEPFKSYCCQQVVVHIFRIFKVFLYGFSVFTSFMVFSTLIECVLGLVENHCHADHVCTIMDVQEFSNYCIPLIRLRFQYAMIYARFSVLRHPCVQYFRVFELGPFSGPRVHHKIYLRFEFYATIQVRISGTVVRREFEEDSKQLLYATNLMRISVLHQNLVRAP